MASPLCRSVTISSVVAARDGTVAGASIAVNDAAPSSRHTAAFRRRRAAVIICHLFWYDSFGGTLRPLRENEVKRPPAAVSFAPTGPRSTSCAPYIRFCSLPCWRAPPPRRRLRKARGRPLLHRRPPLPLPARPRLPRL